MYLLSNFSEYCPNNSASLQRYCTITCTENLFEGQVCAHMQNCHTLPLSLINLLTTVVALQARQNTAQVIKINSNTTYQNI